MTASQACHAAAIALAGFMLAKATLAQCPRQILESPSAFADSFGGAVAIHDRHLLVGDGGEHSLCGDVFCANGLVYAYERDGAGDWMLRQVIEPADLAWNHLFGAGIALDGDRVLIGAARIGSGGQANYEFEFDGERWREVSLFQSPDTRPKDAARALSGDTALVPYAFDGLFVFERVDGVWQATEDLRNPDKPIGRSDFGVSAALNDEWVVVGATYEDIIAINGGAAYAYRRLPDGGVELAQKLVAPDVLDGPRFGAPVVLHDDQLFIGARLASRTARGQGVVYVYELEEGLWTLADEITHSNPERFDGLGRSLAVEGNNLVVSAPGASTPTASGGAFLFRRDASGLWIEDTRISPVQPTTSFGVGGISGSTAVLGSPGAVVGTGFPGVVEIFDLDCDACPPDLDFDGALTIFDFLTYLNLFQDADPQADFDGDGELTIFDFLAFQTAFDAGCP
ncbi:MAG: GC-type dockerin domain-anchored protein [Phycisphaerales bacterium]